MYVYATVLAGDTHRYASTHRVCKTEGHTYQSVLAKCTRLLQVCTNTVSLISLVPTVYSEPYCCCYIVVAIIYYYAAS